MEDGIQTAEKTMNSNMKMTFLDKILFRPFYGSLFPMVNWAGYMYLFFVVIPCCVFAVIMSEKLYFTDTSIAFILITTIPVVGLFPFIFWAIKRVNILLYGVSKYSGTIGMNDAE